jgi:thioredoxin 1
MVRLRSLGSLPASAAERKAFDATAFAQAQKDGKPILVDIFRRVVPDLPGRRIRSSPSSRASRNIMISSCSRSTSTRRRADVRALKATSPSTLIAYNGGTEKARTVGDTNPASIAALVDSGL